MVANFEDRFARDAAQIRTDHNGHHCRTSSETDQLSIMSLQPNGEGGGHTAFGMDPVGVGVAIACCLPSI